MKNFFKALGKALIYFTIFLGVQSVVSFFFGVVVSVDLMLQADTEAITEAQLMQSMESEITKYTTLIALLSNIISLLVIWIVFMIRKKKALQEVGISKCELKRSLAAVLFGISFSLLISAAVQMLPFPESLVEHFAESHSTLSGGNPIVNFAAVVLFAPVVEECFFRGLVYSRLKKGMPIVAAAAISSLLFGVLHGEIIWILITFLMGLMLTWVFEKTQSLLPCIAIHMLNNGISQWTAQLGETAVWVDWTILALCLLLLVGSFVYIVRSKKEMETLQSC